MPAVAVVAGAVSVVELAIAAVAAVDNMRQAPRIYKGRSMLLSMLLVCEIGMSRHGSHCTLIL